MPVRSRAGDTLCLRDHDATVRAERALPEERRDRRAARAGRYDRIRQDRHADACRRRGPSVRGGGALAPGYRPDCIAGAAFVAPPEPGPLGRVACRRCGERCGVPRNPRGRDRGDCGRARRPARLVAIRDRGGGASGRATHVAVGVDGSARGVFVAETKLREGVDEGVCGPAGPVPARAAFGRHGGRQTSAAGLRRRSAWRCSSGSHLRKNATTSGGCGGAGRS